MNIDGCYDILKLESLANLESLAQDTDMSLSCYETNKGYFAHSDGQLMPVCAKVGWQLTQLLTASTLHGGLVPRSKLDMFLVGGFHQSAQLVTDIPWSAKGLRSNNGWNQPLKFFTEPLRRGMPDRVKTGSIPKREHRRITRLR